MSEVIYFPGGSGHRSTQQLYKPTGKQLCSGSMAAPSMAETLLSSFKQTFAQEKTMILSTG